MRGGAVTRDAVTLFSLAALCLAVVIGGLLCQGPRVDTRKSMRACLSEARGFCGAMSPMTSSLSCRQYALRVCGGVK